MPRSTIKTQAAKSKPKKQLPVGNDVEESVEGFKFNKTAKKTVEQYSLTEELLELNRTIPATEQGQCSCLGITSLTYPAMNNSVRSNMFTSHVNQFLNPCNPEHPYVFTTAENVAGKHSNSYLSLKEDMVVYKIVVKYKDIVKNPTVYMMFIYDPKSDRYDVINRTPCTDLMENFGYNMNNEVIDSLSEGDEVKKGTVMLKSSSYDEYMNYGYGKNVVFSYTFDPFTSEDAAICSESFAKSMTSIETEPIEIKLNDNDFMLNIYGDPSTGEYKVLPDIGECVSGNILAAIRRLSNNQVLYDFKKKNLSKVTTADQKFFVDGKHEVLDIEIFSNNEEIKDTTFNRQINKYLRAQNEYYSEIHQICEEIMLSGSKYSPDIDYLYKRSGDMIDTKKKWKEKDVAFGNMMIRIQVRRICDLCKGQKLSGRYGNKSVIAQIRPDSAMPYTADGRRINLQFNMLAVINRTTAMPILEIFMNHITWCARKKMATLKTLKEKETLLFTLINDFNPDQYKKMYKTYSALSPKKKQKYIKDAIEEGIYIHEKPMYSNEYLFDRLMKIKDKYDWITADDVYINKWGRRIKCMRQQYLGQMYIIKLKQSDRRGYSSRNSGAIDITGLPTRRYKSRSHLEQTSSTAIRFGEFETLNFSIGLLPDDIAIFHALYRTSIKGRRDLLRATITNQPLGPALDDVYVSRVAEMFKVYFKSMGIGVNFLDEDEIVTPMDDETISVHNFNGKIMMCTDYQYFIMQKEKEMRDELFAENPIMTKYELEKKMREKMRKKFSINNVQYNDDGELLLSSIDNLYDD